MTLITGIHHITAIAGSAQNNLNFYMKSLGLRLVKQTVNFDSPDVYHFYFSDYLGSPGSVLTFFPFGERAKRGKKGLGQVNLFSYAANLRSMEFWKDRLEELGITFTEPENFIGEEKRISFKDTDGLSLEIAFILDPPKNGNQTDEVPEEHALTQFYSAMLNSAKPNETIELLTRYLGYSVLTKNNNIVRLKPSGVETGFCDVLKNPQYQTSTGGAGTVHHIAFKTQDEDSQKEVQEQLIRAGFHVTEVKDRQYFKSIYFREPGGILFEIATNSPGFTTDEALKSLGSSLKLPVWEEPNRKLIESYLPEIKL